MTHQSQTAREPTKLPLNLREIIGAESSISSTSRKFSSRSRQDPKLLVSGPLYLFGKDAPHITIASSRRDSPDIDKVPGPGHYDPIAGNTRRLQPEIRSSRRPQDASSLTSNIDYIYSPTFPEKRQIKIGQKSAFDFFDVNDTPGPDYFPSSALDSQRGHVIAGRHEERAPEVTPGPGHYSPKFNLSKGPMITLPVRARVDGMGEEPTPGPGHYDPQGPQDRSIGHSLCGHANTGRKRARSSLPGFGSDLLAIGPVMVRMSKLEDPADCRRYLAKHSELKGFVGELYEMVLETRPDDPLGMIREHFAAIKESQRGGDSDGGDIFGEDEIVFGEEFIRRTLGKI